MKKILVTYPIPKEGLKELFRLFEVTYPGEGGFTREELLSRAEEYDGILAASLKTDREFIDRAKNVKIISNYGVGYDSIDVAYATQKGILVANTPDSVTEATAELAFGLMLSSMRRITECDRKLRRDAGFKWGVMQNLGHSLFGKTLGIIGMGRIGRAFARRAAASRMKILYHNRSRLPEEMEKQLGAGYVSLQQLLSDSDVISIHTPLSADTRHLLGSEEFALMKPSAFIVNTSRGAVMDEGVLIEYLRNGKIAGAGLDVFEKEPHIPAELLELDNVVLTPHIGTGTIDARIIMAEEASRNIVEFFTSGRVQNTVNPEVLG